MHRYWRQVPSAIVRLPISYTSRSLHATAICAKSHGERRRRAAALCTATCHRSALVNYPGFNPSTAPNDGAGFSKNIGGNSLPNAPPYTVSAGAQYTIPLTSDWAGTLRTDYYWQDYSWWRVFNDLSYDRLQGYTNVNLTIILTSQTGWQVMLYDKNVFNETAITGAFLNSDDFGSDDQRVPDRSKVDRHTRHEELVRGNR